MKGLKGYIIGMVFIFMAVSLLGCGEVDDKHIYIHTSELSRVKITVDDYAWNHVEFGDLELGINLVGSVSSSTHYLKDLILLESSLDPNFSDPNLYQNSQVIRPYQYTILVSLLEGKNRITPYLDGYAFDPPSAIVDTADMAKSSAVVFHASRCREAFAIDPNIDPDDEFATSPVLDHKRDRIYIGTKNGKLYAIDSSMDEIWAKELSPITSNPVVGSEGTIYLGTDEGLKAIDPNGEVRGTYSQVSGPCATPAVDSDGFIYFGSHGGQDNKIYCLDPNMNLQWYKETGSVFSSPAISLNEILYLADGYEKLYAFDLNGFSKWEEELVAGVISSPAIDANDVLYVRDRLNNLYAYYAEDPNNPKIWEPSYDLDPNSPADLDPADLDPDSPSSPIVGADGRIYLVFSNENDNECYLYAFDPNMECSRLATLTGALSSSPVIGNDNTIYVSTTHYDESNKRTVTLYALDPNGTSKWNPPYIIKDDEPSDLSWPQELLIGQDEATIYMVDRNKVYAVVCPSDNLAESSWPMVGKDTARTSSGPEDRKPPMVKLLGVDYDPNNGAVEFTWKNPDVSDFNRVEIIRDPNDYITVYEGALDIVYQGTAELFSDSNIDLTSFYYTIFTRDTGGNYSEGVTVGGLANSAWPCKAHDARRTGRSPYAGQEGGAETWDFQIGDYSVYSSPAIDANGTVYVGSSGSVDGKVYAIDPNGSSKWEFTTDAGIISSPAVGLDGTVYVGSTDSNIYAIDPNGDVGWKYDTEGVIHSSPAVGADGTVYIGSHDGNVYAINPNGSLKWEFATGGSIISSPMVGLNATVYVGSSDGNVYAFNPNGTLLWKFRTEGSISSSPAIGRDGTIYIGSLDSNLYALNPNGSLRWKYQTDNQIYNSPSVGASDEVYILSSKGGVYAIGSDGSLNWEASAWTTATLMPNHSPAIGLDGTIYIVNAEHIYAFDADGHPAGSYDDVISSSLAIDADGAVYFGSSSKISKISSTSITSP